LLLNVGVIHTGEAKYAAPKLLTGFFSCWILSRFLECVLYHNGQGICTEMVFTKFIGKKLVKFILYYKCHIFVIKRVWKSLTSLSPNLLFKLVPPLVNEVERKRSQHLYAKTQKEK